MQSVHLQNSLFWRRGVTKTRFDRDTKDTPYRWERQVLSYKKPYGHHWKLFLLCYKPGDRMGIPSQSKRLSKCRNIDGEACNYMLNGFRYIQMMWTSAREGILKPNWTREKLVKFEHVHRALVRSVPDEDGGHCSAEELVFRSCPWSVGGRGGHSSQVCHCGIGRAQGWERRTVCILLQST